MIRIESGYTLIELVVAIVILGVVVVGLLPVFSNILSSSHRVGEMHQGALLVRERMEDVIAVRRQMGFTGFAELTAERFGDEIALDLGGPILFDRSVSIQGGEFYPIDGSLGCGGFPYNGEAYKCVKVVVKTNGEGVVLSQRSIIFAK